MRSIFKAMLTLVPMAVLAQSPAQAAADGWRQSCSGPAYICGGDVAASKKVAVKAPKTSPAVAEKPAKAVKAKVAKAKIKKPVEVSNDDTPVKVKAKKKVASAAKPKVKVAKAADDNRDEVAPKAKKKVAKASKSGGGSAYQSGMASWYGGNFNGRKTANGEIYNMNEMTAAHKTLPFGTLVRVTNTRNGDTVDVRINDRGPFVGGRIIDLSRAAASDIGLTASGVAPVKIAIIGKG